MHVHLTLLVSSFALFKTVLTAPTSAPQVSNIAVESARQGHYILRYHEHISDVEFDKHEQEIQAKLGVGCTQKYNFETFKACHLETDEVGLAAITSPIILSYELDSQFSINPSSTANSSITSDPKNDKSSISSTHTITTQASAAWNLGRISHRKPGNNTYVYNAQSCQGITIYVIDTGIRISHTEFGGRARYGNSFVTGVLSSSDDHGHGTHVAGTAAGATIGVCRAAQVVGVKVLDKTGFGYNTWIIAGIQWAVHDALSRTNATGKSVLSISIEGAYSSALNGAVTAAVAAGLPVFVAAGNKAGDSSQFSPSSALGAMIVGATDGSDNKASFSNFGKGVSVWAPGVGVLSAFNNCDTCYYWYDGTSQATPHIAGLAAYFMSLDHISKPTDVLAKIRHLATNRAVSGALRGASNKMAYNGNGA